ncbi:MAG: cysteine desulfurase NifS [Ruthenibacterium sp.]
MSHTIYLDNAATTPVSQPVLDAMLPYFCACYGNPSSHYSIGYETKDAIDTARAQVAKALNCLPAEIFFTGCGTESDNWAIKGTAYKLAKKGKKHLITSVIEHHAVLNSMAALEKEGFTVTYLPVDDKGFVNPADVEAAIRPDTALVTIMYANNEIGTIEPVAKIGEICRKHGVWFHTDAVQAAGAVAIDVQAQNIDMLSLSAHKFNGPKGTGALYVRRGVLPYNFMDGGGQENHRRAGTENIAGIVGLGAAFAHANETLRAKSEHQAALRDYVVTRVLKNIPQTHLNGDAVRRLPGNANIRFAGLEGETILMDLDMHGVCASTGSACNSDSLDPSHVLLAIGLPHEAAHGTMRFSFGPQNTMEEAEQLCEILEKIIPARRAMSPIWNA